MNGPDIQSSRHPFTSATSGGQVTVIEKIMQRLQRPLGFTSGTIIPWSGVDVTGERHTETIEMAVPRWP